MSEEKKAAAAAQASLKMSGYPEAESLVNPARISMHSQSRRELSLCMCEWVCVKQRGLLRPRQASEVSFTRKETERESE